MVTINIDVISDPVCVWCYVGKRMLSRAIEIYRRTYPGGKEDAFIITWRPYYLNPNAFTPSIDKSEAKKIKLANWSPEKIAAATNRMNQVGQSVGITFKSGGKIGNTREAHRLVEFVQTRQVDPMIQDDLVEGIFRAYHEQEKDISEQAVLHEIAIDAGLDATAVAEWLAQKGQGCDVDFQATKNREVVSAGVPFFIIGGVHTIDGAQDPSEFLEALIKVREAN